MRNVLSLAGEVLTLADQKSLKNIIFQFQDAKSVKILVLFSVFDNILGIL